MIFPNIILVTGDLLIEHLSPFLAKKMTPKTHCTMGWILTDDIQAGTIIIRDGTYTRRKNLYQK